MITQPVMYQYQEDENASYIEWTEKSGYVHYFYHGDYVVLIFIDGQEIQGNTFQLNEGTTNVDYIITNQDMEIVEQGTKTFFHDSKAPDIHVYANGFEIDDICYVEDTMSLSFQIDDASSTETHLYVDGEEVEMNSTLDITSNNESIYLESVDVFGRTSIKNINIQSIEKPSVQSSIENESYTVEDTVYFDSEEELEIIIIQKDKEIDCISSHEAYKFPNKGEYTLLMRFKEIPYHMWEFLHCFYTNEKPWISIGVSTLLSNETVYANIAHSNDFIQSIQVKVNDQFIDSLESIELKPRENEDVIYKIEAYIEDMFNQVSTDTKIVHIDTLIPSGDVYFGNQRIQNNTVSFIDLLPVSIQKNKDSIIQILYLYEGKEYADRTLEEMLKDMKENTSMTSIITFVDSLGNQSSLEIIWNKLMKVLETKDEQTNLSITSQDGIVYERIWQEDEENHLVLKKNERVIQDTTKPKIGLLQNNQLVNRRWKKNDICRISILQNTAYSNDTITKLLINGKKIDPSLFQMDSLNNMYYEFSIKGWVYDIEVHAKDDSNNTTIFYEKIYRMPSLYILLILPLLYAGWKYREKNTRM